MRDFLDRAVNHGDYVIICSPRPPEPPCKFMIGRVLDVGSRTVLVRYRSLAVHDLSLPFAAYNDTIKWDSALYYGKDLMVVVVDEYALQQILKNPIPLD